MPNRRVYRDCPYCGGSFSFVEMRDHRARCPKHPLATNCRFCGDRLYLRKNFQPHIAVCPKMPPIPPDHALCSACQDILPIAEFSHKHRRKECHACHSAKAEIVRKTPEYKLKHRHQNLRGMYGVTKERYEQMLAEQGGKCAACGDPPKGLGVKDRYLHVDHDHSAGYDENKKPRKIRQLLCNDCNHAVGKVHDSASKAYGVFLYLSRHNPETITATAN